MKIVQGDLIQMAMRGHFDVIVHGCNQRQTWGAGIARQMAAAFPEAFDADRRSREPDRQLGMISIARVHIETPSMLQIPSFDIHVVNAYTQCVPGAHDSPRNRGIDIIRNVGAAMARVKTRFAGARIGYPQIGAGLARGPWQYIAEIIDHELSGENHTCVEYAAVDTPWALRSGPDLTYERQYMGQWRDVDDGD